MSELEQAFPRPIFGDGGMTLRDHFAGKAMQALLHPQTAAATLRAIPQGARVCDEVAKTAFQIADSMLEARKGGPA